MKNDILSEPGEFCKVIGITHKNRILEFLLETRGIDYGIGDLARETRLNRITAYVVMKELITQGIVKKTRIIGRTQLYMINTNNEVV
ncbi:MAG TPA: hypothetical protein VJH88_06280, partial [Candidatus Nanoarchaeia archaeon]|nr:hypothetical protein [Candidatus Nanoarchaeia archaeon]